jgi:hypothetical protein
LAPHHVGLVGVSGMRDQPLFMVSGTLHGSSGEKANALNAPLINPGTGFKPSVRLSLVA